MANDTEEYLELFSNSTPKPAPSSINDTTFEEDNEGSPSARKHISIKVRQSDIDSLKKEAEKRGLRYQSLINSILHQYVTGRLKSV